MTAATLLAELMPADTTLAILPEVAGAVLVFGVTVSLLFAGYKLVRRVIRSAA